MTAANGDFSKLNIDAADMKNITATATANVEAKVSGGNITLTGDQQKAVTVAIQAQVAENINRAGGASSITLSSSNQAKLDSMEASFTTTAQGEVAKMKDELTNIVDSEYTPEKIESMRQEIKNSATVKIVSGPDKGQTKQIKLSDESVEKTLQAKISREKADKMQKLVGEKIDAITNQLRDKAHNDLVTQQCVDDFINSGGRDGIVKNILIKNEETELVKQHLIDKEVVKGATNELIRQKTPEIKTTLMQKAVYEELQAGLQSNDEYLEGLLSGDYTDKLDGSHSSIYSSTYAANKETSNNGVKTKNAEDLAWDKIKKAVLDKDKEKK